MSLSTNELANDLSRVSIKSAPTSPDEVLDRCNHLLAELKVFHGYVNSRKYNGDYRQKTEYNHFRSDIEGEVRSMQKLKSDEDLPPERANQLVWASNLTYWEALWDAAKSTKQIVTLRRHGSPIDIVSANGTQWIKVSTITEKRLLLEMAKQGWDWAGSDSENDDEDDDDYGSSASPYDFSDISLIKMAITLRDLAKQSRIKYQIPQITFILTRINAGSNKDIDMILEHIRATGAEVKTADQLSPAQPIEAVLEKLGIDEFQNFTPTLNVDCTLLLAIVSDISHGQVKEEPWFNRNVRNQIKIEEEQQLMTISLWPAMSSRRLVCTRLAAKRMGEIVDLIGTPTEKKRMAVLMGEGEHEGKTKDELLEAFMKLSVHDVPKDWQLPVKVVDEDKFEQAHATKFHTDVMGKLVDVNRSVFMYGWLSGYTTISSNRVATKTVERAVEEFRTTEDQRGPDVWICSTARSLVAKEKNRPDHISSKREDSGFSSPTRSG